MNDDLLIDLVSKNSLLYDPTEKYYYDSVQKDIVWDEIAAILGSSVSDCKKKWTSLRDNFRKVRKKRKLDAGTKNSKQKQWRYEENMTFLVPYLSERDHKSATSDTTWDDTSDNDEQVNTTTVTASHSQSPTSFRSLSDTSLPTSTQPYSQLKYRKESISALQTSKSYFENKSTEFNGKPDALLQFFEAMAETVRTFDPLYQIEIKGKIANLVTEYELKNLVKKENANI